MRVFVTGASGWIGSAVVPELLEAGHRVVGLARSDASAAKLQTAGAEVVRGDLGDLETIREASATSDGVIHLAFGGAEHGKLDAAVQADARVVQTIGEALEGSGKPFVMASGTPALPGRISTENDSFAPGSPVAGRGINAQTALAFADRGVRSSVVRLPRSVYGNGDTYGFLPRLIGVAREKGVSGYVGEGINRWPAVHVLDAAHLFCLALEKAPAGSMLHAVGDEGVRTIDIADVIGRHLELPTGSLPAEDFGFLGPIFRLDQPSSSALTRELLGWTPTRPGLIADLDEGHYFSA